MLHIPTAPPPPTGSSGCPLRAVPPLFGWLLLGSSLTALSLALPSSTLALADAKSVISAFHAAVACAALAIAFVSGGDDGSDPFYLNDTSVRSRKSPRSPKGLGLGISIRTVSGTRAAAVLAATLAVVGAAVVFAAGSVRGPAPMPSHGPSHDHGGGDGGKNGTGGGNGTASVSNDAISFASMGWASPFSSGVSDLTSDFGAAAYSFSTGKRATSAENVRDSHVAGSGTGSGTGTGSGSGSATGSGSGSGTGSGSGSDKMPTQAPPSAGTTIGIWLGLVVAAIGSGIARTALPMAFGNIAEGSDRRSRCTRDDEEHGQATRGARKNDKRGKILGYGSTDLTPPASTGLEESLLINDHAHPDELVRASASTAPAPKNVALVPEYAPRALFTWYVATTALAKFGGEFAWPFLDAETTLTAALGFPPCAAVAALAVFITWLVWSHTRRASQTSARVAVSDPADDVVTSSSATVPTDEVSPDSTPPSITSSSRASTLNAYPPSIVSDVDTHVSVPARRCPVRSALPLLPLTILFYCIDLSTDLTLPFLGFSFSRMVGGARLPMWVTASMPLLCTAIVAPAIEFCSARWSPHSGSSPRNRVAVGSMCVVASCLMAASLASAISGGGHGPPSVSALWLLPQSMVLGAGTVLIAVAALEKAFLDARGIGIAAVVTSKAVAAAAAGLVGTRMDWIMKGLAGVHGFLAHAGIAFVAGASIYVAMRPMPRK